MINETKLNRTPVVLWLLCQLPLLLLARGGPQAEFASTKAISAFGVLLVLQGGITYAVARHNSLPHREAVSLTWIVPLATPVLLACPGDSAFLSIVIPTSVFYLSLIWRVTLLVPDK